MTSVEARRIVVGSIVVMGALTFAREARKGRLPEPRVAVGAFGAALLLNMLAGPLPDVAAGLALVAVITHTITERVTLGSLSELFE